MKIKKAMVNIVIYALLGWSVISAGYLALPIELQEMLPQMNWITAVVSGGSTGLLGTGGLYLLSKLSKTDTATNEKFNLMTEKFLTITANYKSMETEVKGLRNENRDLKNSIDENNKLQKVSLQAKLSNPFISDISKQAIEGVVNEE